jgi:poly-gamma-glutamate capsule biosynthesis protein CapA/YwtB (metallophosphatase superfamily)
MKFRYSFILPSALLLLFSCKTVPNAVTEKTSQKTPPVLSPVPVLPVQESPSNTTSSSTLTLLFGGDIMAHTENFSMSCFSVIWKDVAPLIRSADFSFANIESPVDDDIPYSSFPSFNMHHEYPEAAIQAGFNVFSLVNNHSNDQGCAGIMNTFDWAHKTENRYADSLRQVYFAGLHNKKNEPVDYVVIKKGRWTIIFCAVTEILNSSNSKEYMNYVPPDKKSRRDFEERIKEIKNLNQCDLFILSVHAAIPEYVCDISASQRKYYHALLNSGADIIWANHPHVVQEREIVCSREQGVCPKLIMYSNGNTISGQRRNPQFTFPYCQREYTGDGLLYKVTYTKTDGSTNVVLADTEPYYITTYIDTAFQFVVKYLDDDFINFLKIDGHSKWASYISERKKIMEKIKETKTWL